MTTPTPGDDDFTELVDADIPRVDLVDKAANGLPFLITKSQAGLLDAELVRGLIAKAEPAAAPAQPDTVTMTGSPAAIAKLIHQAAVAKAKYDADDLRRMADTGQAMSDQSYPIADRDDLTRAIHAVGRGDASHDAIRRHILTRAKALGAASEIPDNWNSDGSLKEGPVQKMDLDTTPADDDLMPDDPIAAGDEAPGDPAEPGSPAWEAVDAATARKWTSVLARAKHAVSMLADREMTEGVTVDPGDIDNAIDLEDACCAIDYAISVLAPFAVAEQAEADCAAEQMAAVGKALGDWDTAPLDTIEAFAHVAKAGRVLSTGNEAAIRGAVEQLQKVLASLPAAPEITEESGHPVAKQEDAVAEAATPKTEPAPEPVTKAEQTPQVPIYDRKGNLVGIVDPGSIVPIAVDEDDDEPEAPAEAPMDEPAEVALAAEDPQTTDLTPEPSGEVGIPADAVPAEEDDITKTTTLDDTPSDAESSNTDVSKSPDGRSATQEQAIAKQAAVIAQLAETVETLKAQVRTLEEQPAEPKVFTNGAVPPPHTLRGQDHGAPQVDVTKAQEMKKGLYGATDATAQNAIATDMQQMAIARLQEIHHGGARQ